MPSYQPIVGLDGIFVGTDETLSVAVYQSGTSTPDSPGTPQDITGWTVQFILHASGSTTALITKSATITDGPGGQLSVSLAAADTASLAGGNYFYRIERTNSGSDEVLTYGPLLLLAK